tara:strand:+ start:388 stop:768 length:381 start_codon:yes stop_codon:yes gene_type:complete
MSISNKNIKYWVTNPEIEFQVDISDTKKLTENQFCNLVKLLINENDNVNELEYNKVMEKFCTENYVDGCANYNISVSLIKNANIKYVFNEENIKELLELLGFLKPTIREKYLEFLIFKKEQSSGRL